jgi:hypothetical protein
LWAAPRAVNPPDDMAKERQRKGKLKVTYIWQMATKWGRYRYR